MIQIPYFYEQPQQLRFVIDDYDKPQEYTEFTDDAIGEIFTTLSEIVRAKDMTFKGKIDRYYPYSKDARSWKRGDITIRGEKMQMSNQFARFKFSWQGVDNNFDRGCMYLRLCYRQRRSTYFTIKR